jgi:pyruvate dehydrogenase E1 component beta subunit
MKKYNYGTAILSGFEYLLENYPETFVIGQGLWSPWYVGNTMTDLDKKFGVERIIDTPVSESACTGAAVGAALAGMKPIVVHPRMDFMLYAIDPIVNQAAKWSHMLGGQSNPGVTIRSIINRGGEQGAQHSQALHSWFAHIPGLRVVMPSTVQDARDLLISSVLSKDPVMFIDDRWCYDQEDILNDVIEIDLDKIGPKVLKGGEDITIAACGYGTYLAQEAENILSSKHDVSAEIIDVRILNPFNPEVIIDSVRKTRNLLVVDPGTKTSSFSAEIVSSVVERIPYNTMESQPARIALPDAPAPTSRVLESDYYFTDEDIVIAVKNILNKN